MARKWRSNLGDFRNLWLKLRYIMDIKVVFFWVEYISDSILIIKGGNNYIINTL